MGEGEEGNGRRRRGRLINKTYPLINIIYPLINMIYPLINMI